EDDGDQGTQAATVVQAGAPTEEKKGEQKDSGEKRERGKRCCLCKKSTKCANCACVKERRWCDERCRATACGNKHKEGSDTKKRLTCTEETEEEFVSRHTEAPID